MVDSEFLRQIASRCRALSEEAVKWSLRKALADMADDLDRAAAEQESSDAMPSSPLR